MVEYIGRYQISETLGRGGMGTVYKAIDPNLERVVAIKCLNDELSDNELVIAQFLREARSVAALSHPNCVRLYLADEQDGKPYLVMEYVDGETLAERLRKSGALALEEADRIASDCARALAAADEKKIVHRDVKPANIMIDRNGRTLLTDFGIAQIQYEMATKGATNITGTPGYMPPELVRDGKSDRRGDIFSLGAVYYEMLTGRRLIEGRDLPSCNAALTRPGFPDLSLVIERFGDATASRLKKMLDPDPDRRYADYQAVLADFAPNEAALSERAQETAPTRVFHRNNAQTEQPATVSVEPGDARAPVTRTVPLDGRARWQRVGLIAAVIVCIAVMSIAIALTTGGEDPAANPGPDEVMDQPLAAEEIESTGEIDGGDAKSSQSGAGPLAEDTDSTAVRVAGANTRNSAAGHTQPALNEPKISAAALLRELRAERSDNNGGSSDPAIENQTDTRVAMIDSAGVPDAAPSAVSARNRGPALASAARSNTGTTRPDGISVIGVGDLAIAEPIAALIKQRLQSAGLPMVEHRFIPGIDRYLLPDGLDLAGLTEPATNAGVRYVVMARAVAAGSRELNFYGRRDIAYSVQIDTVTYDLVQASQLGASRTRQIEYTSLNANKKARSAAMPWLERIVGQFEP